MLEIRVKTHEELRQTVIPTTKVELKDQKRCQ